MQLPVFQIDAFTDRVFHGNPAAVVPLTRWLPDRVLQAMAMEHQQSETAFFVPRSGGPEGAAGDEPTYDLRWFTPTREVDLCGHATLASAWLVLRELTPTASGVHFHTRSGWLSVRDGDDGRLAMDFPSNMPERTEIPVGAADALGAPVVAAWRSHDNVMLVVDDEAVVARFSGSPSITRSWSSHLAIVTAPAADTDGPVQFVSRVFAPGAGIDEDAVTGSAHTILAPYWASRLNRTRMRARQISARGGDLWLTCRDGRVVMEGHAVLYSSGLLNLPG